MLSALGVFISLLSFCSLNDISLAPWSETLMVETAACFRVDLWFKRLARSRLAFELNSVFYIDMELFLFSGFSLTASTLFAFLIS